MGLLGNVAEVKDIRHRLMTASFIKVFSDLLDSKSDGIEVGSYKKRYLILYIYIHIYNMYCVLPLYYFITFCRSVTMQQVCCHTWPPMAKKLGLRLV